MSDASSKEIEQKLIKQVAAILNIAQNKVAPDALLHTLGVDSLSFVELLVFIEKDLKIKLMESGITREDFRTIRSLARCIDKAKG